jgi:hypothetical protein
MSRAKSQSLPKSAKPRTASLRQKKTQVKSVKRKRRMLNGIPLKRKVVWTYDTDSPEFNAIWELEMKAIKTGPRDPGVEQFLDQAWRDINRSMGST